MRKSNSAEVIYCFCKSKRNSTPLKREITVIFDGAWNHRRIKALIRKRYKISKSISIINVRVFSL